MAYINMDVMNAFLFFCGGAVVIGLVWFGYVLFTRFRNTGWKSEPEESDG